MTPVRLPVHRPVNRTGSDARDHLCVPCLFIGTHRLGPVAKLGQRTCAWQPSHAARVFAPEYAPPARLKNTHRIHSPIWNCKNMRINKPLVVI